MELRGLYTTCECVWDCVEEKSVSCVKYFGENKSN